MLHKRAPLQQMYTHTQEKVYIFTSYTKGSTATNKQIAMYTHTQEKAMYIY